MNAFFGIWSTLLQSKHFTQTSFLIHYESISTLAYFYFLFYLSR